ncbi:ABC transporter permease [Aquabacterium sp. OR-4]|uniref:ABC transporter permease n=1 Tax=Aquabacterium sp. OR-4 TaxID=2978127 RepID=UPI0021B4CD01|nr:ABC transporter permease subunit [Aquabacterium sp. OR-4]MDT7835343.1 ABC transporter permease subunit [Aquabacterium sp. OR-4]
MNPADSSQTPGPPHGLSPAPPLAPARACAASGRGLARPLALALLGALALLAVLGPWLSGHDPRVQQLDAVRALPSAAHWLGTDHLGRDQFTRLALALRLSLGLALATVAMAALAGSALGLAAAWRGGWPDRLATTLADAVQALPGLLLVLLVAAISPGDFGPLYAGLALALWVEFFRVVRLMGRGVLQGAPVEAARLLGFGPLAIVRRHLWPELAPVLLTLAAFGAAAAVLALATLGFVGVGLQPPTAELGLMLIELLPYWREAPWLLLPPVSALVLLTAGFMLLARRGHAP